MVVKTTLNMMWNQNGDQKVQQIMDDFEGGRKRSNLNRHCEEQVVRLQPWKILLSVASLLLTVCLGVSTLTVVPDGEQSRVHLHGTGVGTEHIQ